MLNIEPILTVFLRKTHTKIEGANVTSYLLHLSVASALNINSVFTPACEMVLELDTMPEVNRYTDFITVFYDRFKKIPTLDEIIANEDDVHNTREKVKLMNRAISIYKQRLKRLLLGTYIGKEDLDLFTGFEYMFQRSIVDHIEEFIKEDPEDMICIYVKLDTDVSPNVYILNATVYSLHKTTSAQLVNLKNSNYMVWHVPAYMLKQLY
jgi:hypothetical protein